MDPAMPGLAGGLLLGAGLTDEVVQAADVILA
jgi:hypothetical protein